MKYTFTIHYSPKYKLYDLVINENKISLSLPFN